MSVLPFLLYFVQYHILLHMFTYLFVSGSILQHWCSAGLQPTLIHSTHVLGQGCKCVCLPGSIYGGWKVQN
jgi:hypothetical protein